MTLQHVQLSVFQISAVVLVVTEVNPKPNPKRGPLVAWSFIAWVAKSQAWCVDALRSVHFAHSFNILPQQLIKFSFKPASACNSLGVCFCNFVFWLNHLPVRFNNSKREGEPKQHFFPMLTVCHRCCTPELSHRGPCVRCRLSLRRCPSPPGRFTPASSCFFFFSCCTVPGLQQGNVHDLRCTYLMNVLVTSSRLRGLQAQTCVSTHAVTRRTGAEPSYKPRCFISCELRSSLVSQLEVCFLSAAQRWADSLICD